MVLEAVMTRWGAGQGLASERQHPQGGFSRTWGGSSAWQQQEPCAPRAAVRADHTGREAKRGTRSRAVMNPWLHVTERRTRSTYVQSFDKAMLRRRWYVPPAIGTAAATRKASSPVGACRVGRDAAAHDAGRVGRRFAKGRQLPVMPNNFLLWPVGAGYRGRMPVEVDLLAGLPLRDAARPCVQKVVKNLAGTSAYRLAATVGRWAAYLNVFLTAVRSPLGQLRDVLYFSRQINRDHPQGGTGYKF